MLRARFPCLVRAIEHNQPHATALAKVAWGSLRWVALALGAYGVLWVVMWVCAERVHPHYASDSEFVLRSGPMTVMRIPLSDLTSAKTRGLADPDDDTLVMAAPLVPANLDVVLARPATKIGWLGKPKGQHQKLALALDDAANAARVLS